jgi:hypothetical protein
MISSFLDSQNTEQETSVFQKIIEEEIDDLSSEKKDPKIISLKENDSIDFTDFSLFEKMKNSELNANIPFSSENLDDKSLFVEELEDSYEEKGMFQLCSNKRNKNKFLKNENFFNSQFEKSFKTIFKIEKVNSCHDYSFESNEPNFIFKDVMQDSTANSKEKITKAINININSNIYSSFEESKKSFCVFENVGKKIDNKSKSYNFLNKKRLFSVDNLNTFAIFSPGLDNGDSDQLIKEALNTNNNEYNFKDEKKNENENSNQKRVHLTKRNASKRTRKYNADNIKKKIKSRFFKDLRFVLNKRLKNAGVKKQFKAFSYSFINNTNIKVNQRVWNLSFKDFICDEININKNYNDNKNVLECLENNYKNPKIGEKSNCFIFINRKIGEIFKEYLKSIEFQNQISEINKKEGDKIYVENYIILAHDFSKFYL